MSGEENPLQGWLRYWVVLSCAAVPDTILAALQVQEKYFSAENISILKNISYKYAGPSPPHSQDNLHLLVSLPGTFQWHRTTLQSGLLGLIIFLQKLNTQLRADIPSILSVP